MNTNEYLRHAALELLRSDPAYAEDARQGAAVGNTIGGSVLSLTYKAPRWAAEEAVRLALVDLEEGGDA